jgi:hypothetical protein
MAKEVCCPMCTSPCCGIVLLVLGVLLLLQNIGTITWFIVSPWTLVFLIAGVYILRHSVHAKK